MDYILIVKILAYAGIVRALVKYELGSVFSALVAIGGPFLFELFLKFIMLSVYDIPLSELVTFASVVVLVIQLIIAMGVFTQLKKHDEDISAWFFWAIGGGVVVIAIVPYVIGLIIGR